MCECGYENSRGLHDTNFLVSTFLEFTILIIIMVPIAFYLIENTHKRTNRQFLKRFVLFSPLNFSTKTTNGGTGWNSFLQFYLLLSYPEFPQSKQSVVNKEAWKGN